MDQRGFIGDYPFPQKLTAPALSRCFRRFHPPLLSLSAFRGCHPNRHPGLSDGRLPPPGTAGPAETLPKNRHRRAGHPPHGSTD